MCELGLSKTKMTLTSCQKCLHADEILPGDERVHWRAQISVAVPSLLANGRVQLDRRGAEQKSSKYNQDGLLDEVF